MLIAVAREIIRETPLPKLVLVFSRPVWRLASRVPDFAGRGSCELSFGAKHPKIQVSRTLSQQIVEHIPNYISYRRLRVQFNVLTYDYRITLNSARRQQQKV